jgi:hypothetical protein
MAADSVLFTPNIPVSLSREIGRIIVKWAFLENYVQRTVCMVTGITLEEGAFVLREPRLEDRLQMLVDIVELRGLRLNDTHFKAVQQNVADSAEIRNLCAHGAWAFVPRERQWAVRNTQGSWSDRQHLPKTLRKKKVLAEGLLLDVDSLRIISTQLEQAINHAMLLHDDLFEQILASPDKWPRSSRKLPPSLDPKKRT